MNDVCIAMSLIMDMAALSMRINDILIITHRHSVKLSFKSLIQRA